MRRPMRSSSSRRWCVSTLPAAPATCRTRSSSSACASSATDGESLALGRVQFLADVAEECPTLRAPQVLAIGEAIAIARTLRLRVHLVVLSQHERLLPFQEIETVFARLFDQLAKLAR